MFRKIFYFICLFLILSSCIDNKVEKVKNDDLIITNSKIEKNNDITEGNEGKENIENENIAKNKSKTGSINGYDYNIKYKNGENFLYLIVNGSKKLIERHEGSIKNIDVINNLLLYDLVSSGGMIKKIYHIKKDIEIEKISFGIITKDKKYIYNCGEGGYGLGSITFFDIENLKKYDYNKELGIGNNGIIVFNCDYKEGTMSFTLGDESTGKEKKNYSLNIKNNTLIKKVIESSKVQIKKTNKNLIYLYYENINKGNLQTAYGMKFNSNISFDEFKKQYSFNKGEYINIFISNLKEIGDEQFDFRVNIFEEKKGIERYKVIMEIINGKKLKTLSVDKINKEIIEKISDGNNTYYVEWLRGSIILSSKISGIVNTIKVLKTEIYENGTYSVPASIGNILGLKLINNNEILVYEIRGWEYIGIGFLNVTNGKIIEEGRLTNYGVSNNKKYFYMCGESGMSGGGIKIYNYPDFTLYKNLVNSLYEKGKRDGSLGYIYNCFGFDGYDKSKNILKFELSKKYIYEYEYDFETGEIIKK